MYDLPIDTIDYLLGKRDELTPPRILKLAGDGDFKEKGREVFRNFVDLCDITSNDLVLDVGCGIGRMAVPLTSYLTTGKYEDSTLSRRKLNSAKRKSKHDIDNSIFNVRTFTISHTTQMVDSRRWIQISLWR